MEEFLQKTTNQMFRLASCELAIEFYHLEEETEKKREKILEEKKNKFRSLFENFYQKKEEGNQKEQMEEVIHLRKELSVLVYEVFRFQDLLALYQYAFSRHSMRSFETEQVFSDQELIHLIIKSFYQQGEKLKTTMEHVKMVLYLLPVRITKVRLLSYLDHVWKSFEKYGEETKSNFLEVLDSLLVLNETTLIPSQEKTEAFLEIRQWKDKVLELDFDTLENDKIEMILKELEQHQESLEMYRYSLEDLSKNVKYLLVLMKLEKDTSEKERQLFFEKGVVHSVFSKILTEQFFEEGSLETIFDEIAVMTEQGIQELGRRENFLEQNLGFDDRAETLLLCSRLLSANLFSDLSDEIMESRKGDAKALESVESRYQVLLHSIQDHFEKGPRWLNRARMAALMQEMYPAFHSIEELAEYVNHAVSHCKNASEKVELSNYIRGML